MNDNVYISNKTPVLPTTCKRSADRVKRVIWCQMIWQNYCLHHPYRSQSKTKRRACLPNGTCNVYRIDALAVIKSRVKSMCRWPTKRLCEKTVGRRQRIVLPAACTFTLWSVVSKLVNLVIPVSNKSRWNSASFALWCLIVALRVMEIFKNKNGPITMYITNDHTQYRVLKTYTIPQPSQELSSSSHVAAIASASLTTHTPLRTLYQLYMYLHAVRYRPMLW